MKKAILDILLRAFPTPIDLNYFEIIGAEPGQILLSDAEMQRFKQLTALLTYLKDEQFIRADYYKDSQNTYYWNIKLTTVGFDALNNADKTG